MHVHLLATLRPPDHAILLAQNDSVTERLGERRRSVHSSSAFHIVDGGLLGDLDLERAPSCGAAHVMAAGLAGAPGDRRALSLGVLLRERECQTGVRNSSGGMPCDAGDMELMVLSSSTLSWWTMGFTGGCALLVARMTNKGFAWDFGSAPG